MLQARERVRLSKTPRIPGMLEMRVLFTWTSESDSASRWVGAFNGVSAFNNSGMSLLDANMYVA